MKKIEMPCINQADVYDEFDSLQYKAFIEENSSKYSTYFEELKSLLDIEAAKIQVDKNYKEYMKKMYSQRFSNKGYPTLYAFYTMIRDSSKYCPYCNYPTHSTRQLDHYFPKAIFPSLSLAVSNLVPICMDCNRLKSEYYSCEKSEMLIHPYFDEFATEAFEFIQCKIIENDHIGFEFNIRELAHWDKTTFNRVSTHFASLELDKLYSSDFEADFSVYFEELKELYAECGVGSVKRALGRKIDSYKKKQIKPWYYAGYTTIMQCNWFFDCYLKQA